MARRYLGQGLLLAAIGLYRRRLSGRGPLRKVRCTFEGTESCSRYGARVAREAASLPEALSLIAGRLRRCREASLYRTDPTAPFAQIASSTRGSSGWLWGELYDGAVEDPARCLAGLERARELPASRGLCLRSAAMVARHGGRDPASARDLLRVGNRLAGPDPAPLLVRHLGQPGIEGALAHRLRRRVWRGLLLATLVGALGLLAGLAAGLLLLTLGVAVTIGAAWSAHRRQHDRFAGLAARARFEVPEVSRLSG